MTRKAVAMHEKSTLGRKGANGLTLLNEFNYLVLAHARGPNRLAIRPSSFCCLWEFAIKFLV